MSDGWGKFWLAMSLMVVAGVLAVAVDWTGPISVGPLAQWVAAAATTGAIWIALRNTRVTLRESATREQKRQKELDRSYIAAVCVLAEEVHENIVYMQKFVGSRKRSIEDIRRIERTLHMGSVIAAIDKLPLHAAPRSDLVLVVVNSRLAAHNAQTKINDAIIAGDPTRIDFSDELDLIRETSRVTRGAFGELVPEVFVKEIHTDRE